MRIAIFGFINKLLISGASRAEVKTAGVRHGSPMKEAEPGEECEDEGGGEPRAGEEAEHDEECEDESEGEPWEPKSE